LTAQFSIDAEILRFSLYPLTVSLFRPLARLRLSTSRPLLVDIRSWKPWTFFRLLLLGWNVLFIMLISPYCHLFSMSKAYNDRNCHWKKQVLNRVLEFGPVFPFGATQEILKPVSFGKHGYGVP
jgi:hypothetical protein